LGQHRGEKLPGHLALQQPVAVFGEGGGIPHRILDPEPDKPAKQQVVVEPVNQLSLRADRVERLQQQGPQQPLRRDRDPPDRRIQLSELARKRLQCRVGDLPNQSQRMVRPDPFLKIDVTEKTAANPIVAAHRHPHPHPTGAQRAKSATLFQQPARPI